MLYCFSLTLSFKKFFAQIERQVAFPSMLSTVESTLDFQLSLHSRTVCFNVALMWSHYDASSRVRIAIINSDFISVCTYCTFFFLFIFG